jgi:uncharacterized protein YacL
MKFDSTASAIGAILGLITAILISSYFTITSINILFGTNIPVNLESMFAMSWFTLFVCSSLKGLLK